LSVREDDGTQPQDTRYGTVPSGTGTVLLEKFDKEDVLSSRTSKNTKSHFFVDPYHQQVSFSNVQTSKTICCLPLFFINTKTMLCQRRNLRLPTKNSITHHLKLLTLFLLHKSNQLVN